MWPFGPVTHYNIPSYTGQVTHYNVTIWAGNPLQYTITKKKILVFFNHWAGRLEQLDHSRFFAFLLSLGRLPKTIWSISKKKGVVSQMICFLISTSLCKGHVSIYYFQGFQNLKKNKKEAKVLSVSNFLYKFITQS